MDARPRRRGRTTLRHLTRSGVLLTDSEGPRSPGTPAIPVLHAVTNDEIVGRADFLARARDIMRAMGDRGALHLRAPKMMDDRGAALVELALALAEEQDRTGAWLVINDRVDVALIVCARGVQLTGESLEVADATQVIHRIGDRTASAALTPAIGASVHSLEEAIGARIAGAAWGVVRDIIRAEHRDPKRSNADRAEHNPRLLDQLVRFGGIPIIVIGGVLPRHVTQLRRVGAHGIAAIRGIWDVEHSERAAIDYLSAYDSEVG